MSNLLKIALQGAFTNFKRIFFAADRVTDMELRKQIATLSVEVDDRVDESACIGCGGCANVCPTGAIEMKGLTSPKKLTDDWIKSEVPEINLEKCVLYVIIVMISVRYFHFMVRKEQSIQAVLEIRKLTLI